MASEELDRLQLYFEKALELQGAERAELLGRIAGEEPELAARVEALLASAGAEGTRVIRQAIGHAARDASGARPAFSSRLAPGTRLGRFEVVSALGAGGMGQVYRARDTALEREVAIKLIEPAALETAAARARFEREARSAAALKHPNVVTVHDVGEDDGRPFLVMELIEGETLRSKMTEGVGESKYLNWAIQVADGLAAAHQAGIAHRDLKPENVIVDREGAAQIVDFGLARAAHAARGADGSEETRTQLTGADTLMGTLGYMSPEAAAGHGTDHRTDQFALGVMLYELATGEKPFDGDTPQEILAATLRDDPPGLGQLARRSPGLAAVIDRCLQKAPERRYSATSELSEALRSLLAAPPRRARAALPRPRTELFGRLEERRAIRRLIVDREVRLVTLSGPGGSGKTRLAIQVAEDLSEHFGGRVVVVELGSIREASLVMPAVARAVGVGGDRAPVEAIVAELADPLLRTLLVLDNFEQVIDAARELGDLLGRVPALSCLVTSREVLRIYGEHDFPVTPLEFPVGDSLPTLETLERYPAVALFAARARAAKPSFALTADNAAAVVELCRRLDGLPLALELAAARARALTPQAMLARLESRKGLLTSGARDLPDRQQTLQATLEWSHDLMEAREKVLFQRLGAFVGGFTLEAAEAVADGYGDLELDVVDGIASLVDKSLVQSVDGSDDESRFTLLETIREFAHQKLTASGEAKRVGKAHAAYYVLLAEEGGARIAQDSDVGWIETLHVEHDNCLSALDWLTENGHIEWGLRLALGLFDFWDRTLYLAEGQRRFTRLLALKVGDEHKPLRAKGLFSAAGLAAARRDLGTSVELQEEALDLYRDLADSRGQAISLNALGIAASTDSFDNEKAREALSEGLEIWKELGDDLGYARSLSNLAWVLKTDGEHEEARRLYRQAGELFSTAGETIDAAWAVNHEADVAKEGGELDEAQALYETALERFEGLDFAWGVATTLADLGALAARRTDWDEAVRLGRRALQIFVELGHQRGVARMLEALAGAALEIGAPETALELMAGAADLRRRLGVPLAGIEAAANERWILRMREAVNPTLAENAWKRGAAAPLDETVRRALDF